MNRLVLLDRNCKQHDDHRIVHGHEQKGVFQRGCAIVKDADSGIVMFEQEIPNKVLVGGSAFTASKHWNIKPKIWTPSYNEILNLENSVNEPYTADSGIRKEESIFLFCVGTDGCYTESTQIKDVDYTKWISPESIVPFRYQRATNDLANYMREKYYGRKVMGDRIGYYFKEFEAGVSFIQQYTDGIPIDENVYTTTRVEEVESYAEIVLKITKEDCREWFAATSGPNDAKINCVSLCTAWKKEIDGFTYYQDIRPLTRLNFGNELLLDATKAIDIIYHVYY